MNVYTSRRAASRAAFTLIELLTVIAIIGILAAIIIPVTGKVRATARAAACASNLRQIGMLMHNFSDDNRGQLPFTSGPQQPGEADTSWSNALGKYVMTEQHIAQMAGKDPWGIFMCPRSNKKVARVTQEFAAYAANITLLNRYRTSQGKKILRSEIAAPSHTYLVTDSDGREFWYSSRAAFTNDGTPSAIERHDGKLNMLYVDGSVRPLAYTEMKFSDSGANMNDRPWGPR